MNVFQCFIVDVSSFTYSNGIMSTASAVRRSSKIALAHMIHQEMLALMVALTPSSPNLASIRSEVLEALTEDIETHIRNDKF